MNENQPILGNEEAMAQVQKLMNEQKAKNLAEAAALGGNFPHTEAIDYTSLEQKRYIGNVVFKKPNMLDYMRMGAKKSEILRQAGVVDIRLVDFEIKEMAQIMSTLSVVIKECPEWLTNLDDVIDYDMLVHVYAKYEQWMNTFRKPSEGSTANNSTTSEGTQAMGTP